MYLIYSYYRLYLLNREEQELVAAPKLS
jgi:hypothetical protein